MRYLAYADDPVAGGSSLEDLIAAGAGPGPTWPDPTDWVPVSAAQVDPGLNPRDRNNEVRGRRAQTAPSSFASSPSLTATVRAYPSISRKVVRNALSGPVATAGVAPAAIASTVQATQTDGSDLRAIIGYLVREGQLDRVSGLVVEEAEFNFPTDEEGSIDLTLQGLYHDVDPAGDVALPTPDFAAGGHNGEVFQLRDLTAFIGSGAGVEIDCLAGLGFTWNNSLQDDMRSRFCAGKNVETTILDAVRHKLWYPDRHKTGPQVVTGRLDFGDVRPDRELRRILSHADKLVAEVAAGPITPATTPAADEMMRLTFYKSVLTGGGAEPLTRDGDQVSSYEFTAYLDETTGKDVEATFTTAAALA
jgi:hypothetical protein